MDKIKNLFKNNKKFRILTYMMLLGIVLLIAIPTLARFRNRISYLDVEVWDGSIATSYKSGSGLEDDPYIISNGAELAYFKEQLITNNYEDTYFKIEKDIVLNDGIIKYADGTGITYIKENDTYYVDKLTGNYYDNADMNNAKIGTINLFDSLNNFKGTLDGNNKTIYGLYIAKNNAEQLSLFTNLNGKINNLYVDNSIIYGGFVTGGIASKANDASITNTVFNGYVIGEQTSTVKNEEVNLDNINILVVPYTDKINITLPFIAGNVISTKLNGSISLENSNLDETEILINGNRINSYDFEITLGTDVTNSINVTVDGAATNISITNLKYSITHEYALSGGIIGEANNSIINNCVNKGQVYGHLNSAGIVGVQTNTSITNSYNEGTIISNGISSGLINKITNNSIDTSIINCYNEGELIAPNDKINLINTINNGSNIVITNTFNIIDLDYIIDTITNSNVNITNSYTVYGNTAANGSTVGTFNEASQNDLKTKSYLISNLNYKEFVNMDDLNINSENIWRYEENGLPKLYIDEEMIIANIHVSTYTWNNFDINLENVNFGSNITFMITNSSSLRPLKEIYYYISNSTTSLTKEQLNDLKEWNIYSNVEEINDEGFYVIYAKVVDFNNNVTYLNSDVLVLDKTASEINIKANGETWNTLKDNLKYKYFTSSFDLSIEANDSLSGIDTVEYYVTDSTLSTTELNNINTWVTYQNPIPINNSDKKIIYVKVKDNCGFVTYANTDYLSLNGYVENNMTIGRNTNNVLNDVNITNKSTISLNYSYKDTVGYSEIYTHNLISNVLLPVNTEITLYDRNTGNVYKYIIPTSDDDYNYNNSCSDDNCTKKATYPFTLFKTINESNQYFNETDYYNKDAIDEDFKVVIDFRNTLITSNIKNISLYLETRDTSGKILRSTIKSSIKKFNIYSSVNNENTFASLYLNSNYPGDIINYNSDSITNVNINTGFDYKSIDGKIINDTINEDKSIGLLIKLVDSSGNIVSKGDLKNIYIKVSGHDYGADEDGIFRINLNNGIDATSTTLSIITSEASTKLISGDYEFKIYSYVAYDGLYNTNLSANVLSIPVKITNTYQSTIAYKFDVMMDDSLRILNKNTNGVELNFSIIEKGKFSKPNIRISLYKKDLPTAYNQNYSKVNLQTFTTKKLKNCGDNVYYAVENPLVYNGRKTSYNNFSFKLNTNDLQNTGYRLVFELYDNDKKIGEIQKNFIVK